VPVFFASLEQSRHEICERLLARALAEKLLSYATGGTPTKSDQPEIEAIVARIRPKDYGLQTLVHEIVQSKVFQYK
jgi:Protein of unknown function (DUF1585)